MSEGHAQYFGTFWIIVGDGVDDGGVRWLVFTLGADGDPKELPVFSFEEEALLFLGLGGLKGHWRASRITATDLVTLLTGPYRGARGVVLDPFPEVGLRGYLGAVNFGREEFVDLLGSGHGRASVRAAWDTLR
ncbi:MAG: hypothetical protein H0U55_07260, partial [Rubrobacteraceae bacterium]|nr:hypothetical protein [Rubrobacteraceae bacterium]